MHQGTGLQECGNLGRHTLGEVVEVREAGAD